jgi:hypothetical protein
MIDVGGSFLSFVWQQFPVQAPSLITYLVGLFLAVASLRRCPGPAVLVLLATGLLLLTTIGGTLVQSYLIQGQTRGGLGMQRVALVMSLVAIVRSLAHALGIGLLLAAAFAGRGRPPGRKPPPIDAEWPTSPVR